MNIAILASPNAPIPPQKYGGTERVIYYLIKGLVEAGHNVTLLGPGDSDVPCELIPIAPQAFIYSKDKAEDLMLQSKRIEAQKLGLEKLREILPRIDIIHSHEANLCDFIEFPNLTTLHGAFILGSSYEVYEQRKELVYASISHNQQNAMPDLMYIGNIYNGFDPEEFPFNPSPQDYVCFIGRFHPEKSPHLALQLAIKLGLKIKIAGKIDFAGIDYFEKECAPLMENPLVEFLGEIGMKEKIELLSNAYCNLHPTGFREPFGLTVLEAAYCGTPTIAIRRGALSETIEDGITGFLVEDIVEALSKVEATKRLDRNYISQRARAFFNYKNMTNTYLLAYENIIKGYKKGIFPTQTDTTRAYLRRSQRLIDQKWKSDSESNLYNQIGMTFVESE